MSVRAVIAGGLGFVLALAHSASAADWTIAAEVAHYANRAKTEPEAFRPLAELMAIGAQHPPFAKLMEELRPKMTKSPSWVLHFACSNSGVVTEATFMHLETPQFRWRLVPIWFSRPIAGKPAAFNTEAPMDVDKAAMERWLEVLGRTDTAIYNVIELPTDLAGADYVIANTPAGIVRMALLRPSPTITMAVDNPDPAYARAAQVVTALVKLSEKSQGK